jgi:hypothetical protein
MWRHGDVFIIAIDAIPGGELRRPGWVLVEGEATGHSHRLDRSGAAERLDRGETLYLRVLPERATVLDHRDRPITLPRGLYQVWKPRECPPGTNRSGAQGGEESCRSRRGWDIAFATTPGAPLTVVDSRV